MDVVKKCRALEYSWVRAESMFAVTLNVDCLDD